MTKKSLIMALLVAAFICGPAGASDTHREGDKRLYRSKPAAPIDVRWISDGDEGRVEVALTCGVDHVGATLRLVVPGGGAPRLAHLPSADAGEIQTVYWELDRQPTRPPRLSVEVDTGDAVMVRQVVAPAPAGKGPRASGRSNAGPQGSRPVPAAGARGQDGEPEERLVRLPAEVSIRKAGD